MYNNVSVQLNEGVLGISRRTMCEERRDWGRGKEEWILDPRRGWMDGGDLFWTQTPNRPVAGKSGLINDEL